MSERVLKLLAGALAVLVIGLAMFWQPALPERAIPKAIAPVAADFTLQSATGPISLKDYQGKLVLLYFGYTFCPDICPTSLMATAEGLKLLTPEELARVAMIFISVDPERDTPERLQEYAKFFHPNIVGATGTPEQIAQITKPYGAFYARQNVETAGGGYVVDHTSDTYIISPDGHYVGKIPHATPPDDVVAEIRKRLTTQ